VNKAIFGFFIFLSAACAWSAYAQHDIPGESLRHAPPPPPPPPKPPAPPPAPPPVVSAVVPDYIVLTVIYAPPGTNGGASKTSVSYEAGSTTGTTTTASKSFKQGTSISVSATAGSPKTDSASVGVSFDYSNSTTDTASLEITKSKTSTIVVDGPAKDGIDHDEDEIWLLLKPTVNVSVSSSTSAVQWALSDTPAAPKRVFVGWLNGDQPMEPGVAEALKSAGITEKEYPCILAHDPLAQQAKGATLADYPCIKEINPGISDPSANNARFQFQTYFDYAGPLNKGDAQGPQSFEIGTNTISNDKTEVDDSYQVGVTVSASVGSPLVTTKLQDKNTWQWTNKSSVSFSQGASQKITATIGGPAWGYTGPTVLEVFYDTIFHTFAFALVSDAGMPVALQGSLVDPTGNAISGHEVSSSVSGKTLRAITNLSGKFTIYGEPKLAPP
jgi:hypothetical protein